MKRILIMSDTHGMTSAFRRVLAKEQELDALLFLGDGLRDLAVVEGLHPRLPVYAVRGNCDFSALEPVDGLAAFGGVCVYYTHGHLFGVKYDLYQLAGLARERGADIALFGHTHIPAREQFGDLTLFNPGSAGMPRHGQATYGLLTLAGGGAFRLEHREVPEFERYD